MKRIFKLGSFVLAFSSLLLINPSGSSAKDITMKYATFFPPTHSQSQLAEAWCKAVEEKTEGRVKFEFYPGSSLLNGKQIYDGVVDDIADVGFSVLAYTAGRFPVTAALDLPLGYPSGVVATKVANDVYNTLKPTEFDDVHLLYLHAHGPGFINTRDKEAKKLEDLKGLRIRSTGMSAGMVKSLGGTPVAQSMGEAYESLQKGVVDGSAHPMEANLGWKLGEVIKYTTRAYSVAYTTTFFVAINKDKWASLDPKDQEIITAINKEWLVKHGEAWDESDKVAMDDFLKKGNTAIDLSDEESARWAVAVAPFIDEYAADISKKGIDGKNVIETIKASLKANM